LSGQQAIIFIPFALHIYRVYIVGRGLDPSAPPPPPLSKGGGAAAPEGFLPVADCFPLTTQWGPGMPGPHASVSSPPILNNNIPRQPPRPHQLPPVRNLPGSLFFTHRLLWNNGSGICQLFLYRINYSSANSTTNLASVAAMASWSLFSKFVFCSILMTWYFTVDGSMPSSFAISL